MIETREWIFRVSCKVNPGDNVFVTGSCEALGSWDPQKFFPLILEGSSDLLSDSQTQSVWTGRAFLPTEQIEYRFCICFAMKDGQEVMNSVSEWETSLHPRIIPPNISNAEESEILEFGYIGEFYKVDRGWLIKENALFLRLSRSNVLNDAIVLWKRKHKNKKCYVKVTSIDMSKSGKDSLLDIPTEESTEAELMELRMKSRSLMPVVEVSVLKEGLSRFKRQEQFGVISNDEDCIVFQCKLMDTQTVGFLMDYYIEMEEEEPPSYLGCSIILPSTFKDGYGVASLPITSPKHIPIGQLTVQYMLVRPLQDHKCNMKVSYARHWKDSWRGLEVGHRGAGNSYHSQTKNCANIRENTIASLKHAAESGADMVEFDVQLSKDHVPVLYHEFHTYISLKHKKEPLKTDLMEIPIKDLTLAQLQALKVFHPLENGLSRFSDEDQEDHQPFPTLEKALSHVDDLCGFNVEIKWTMRRNDGSYELLHPFELNRFLDAILKVVLESSSSRKIIFSCFHPDICTMLRLKQNLYPVLFLTQGEKPQRTQYDDIRTMSVRLAVLYASSADILGVNVHCDNLLRKPDEISLAFEHNQIVFCWGDDNSNQENIAFLKDLGIHGIIYDKIDVYNTKKSKRSPVFLCDDEESCRCFPSSCKYKVSREEDEAPKKEEEEEEQGCSSAKRRKTTSEGEDSVSRTSFYGVLSQEVEP